MCYHKAQFVDVNILILNVLNNNNMYIYNIYNYKISLKINK